MPNTKDTDLEDFHRILCVGKTGTGKTAQIWTLPGKKFAYIFDPNSLATLRGLDLEYKQYLPDFLEMDATLKGFNKNSMDDAMPSKREPMLYMDWVDDINEKIEGGFFKKEKFDWLIFDSLTFMVKAVMDRQLFINRRYGSIEDLGDYRIVGSKITEVFNSIAGEKINVYATGHLSIFQDDKTKKIETQLNLPGKARVMLPLLFTNTWQAVTDNSGDDVSYLVRTRPDARGLQDIRTAIPGLETLEDVTIGDFEDAESYGIGALISRSKKETRNAVHQSGTKRRAGK